MNESHSAFKNPCTEEIKIIFFLCNSFVLFFFNPLDTFSNNKEVILYHHHSGLLCYLHPSLHIYLNVFHQICPFTIKISQDSTYIALFTRIFYIIQLPWIALIEHSLISVLVRSVTWVGLHNMLNWVIELTFFHLWLPTPPNKKLNCKSVEFINLFSSTNKPFAKCKMKQA